MHEAAGGKVALTDSISVKPEKHLIDSARNLTLFLFAIPFSGKGKVNQLISLSKWIVAVLPFPVYGDSLLRVFGQGFVVKLREITVKSSVLHW